MLVVVASSRQSVCMIRFPVFMVLGPLGSYFVFVGFAGGFKGHDARSSFRNVVACRMDRRARACFDNSGA
jgi:hypothetical protein